MTQALHKNIFYMDMINTVYKSGQETRMETIDWQVLQEIYKHKSLSGAA